MVSKINLMDLHKKQVAQTQVPKPADISTQAKTNPLAALIGKQAAKPSVPLNQGKSDPIPAPVVEPVKNPPPPATVPPKLSLLSQVRKAQENPDLGKQAEEPEADAEPEPESKAVAVVTRMTPEESKELVPTIEAVEVITEDFIGGFKERLEKLDRLIQVDTNLSSYTIDAARNHVKQIMIDLKEQPELDSCLIDRDVHNILRFIRSVKDTAIQEKAVVKVKKAAKAGKGRSGASLDLDSLPMITMGDIAKFRT